MKATIYNGLNFTTRKINRTFKIKVNGVNFTGSKMNKLVGVSGLIQLVGVELANTMLEKAFRCQDDKSVQKLRRGLKVTFYYY